MGFAKKQILSDETNNEAAVTPVKPVVAKPAEKELSLETAEEGTVVKIDQVEWPSINSFRQSKWSKYETLKVGEAAINFPRIVANTIATRLRKLGMKITVAKLNDTNYAIKRTA